MWESVVLLVLRTRGRRELFFLRFRLFTMSVSKGKVLVTFIETIS